ncbi:NADH-ubiquinone oxidoreductase-F iron-sulfur binding region domain-containing protein [Caenispirillum bisanense]|uniref:NADH-ubiquinone oxidoreductase-F iron-sulfur binding region domain-containing protein n=1 Tax=Caenispirillum bisanense TaxID=414052 RepID=UPI0031D63005
MTSPAPTLEKRPAARTRRRGPVVDPAALAEVERLTVGVERRRDLLIEALHCLNDALGCLPEGHLVALATLWRLAPVEVFEVATFYAHFEVVPAGAPLPPPLAVRLCDGPSCRMAGADALHDAVAAAPPDGCRVVAGPCMGRCDQGPVALVGRRAVTRATPKAIAAAAAEGGAPRLPGDAQRLAHAHTEGVYRVLASLRAGQRSVEEVLTTLEEAGLRGLGGAGFPTARKWHTVRQMPGPRAVCVNADEGEPGTLKDRLWLEGRPHRVIEGALIAAWAVEADLVVIYLRDEYPEAHALLLAEIAEVIAHGLAGGVTIELRRGAGAYICGEESAMIESIEGKRGWPRHRPPYVAQAGLFGRPTVVNNVETLCWVPEILEKGAAWWQDLGRHGRHGLRAFSVSGRVRLPGVKVAPAGITLTELLAEYCGGMAEGHRLKAFLPGGASGGIMPAALADLPLDFGSFEPHGGFIGSGAVVVFSHADDLREVARDLMRFMAHESCGQCTPCRVGCDKAVSLLEAPALDTDLLADLAQVMRDGSICGLGQAAPNIWQTLLRHFPEEARR